LFEKNISKLYYLLVLNRLIGNKNQMVMNKQILTERLKEFGLRVIRMVDKLPESRISNVITNQILRSSTSICANYRAACRSKSRKDFINKLKIAEEETDETLYWLELIEDAKLITPEKIINLKKESEELLSIFVSSLKTAKQNINKSPIN
jgi:four helix bundle protein